MSDYAIAGLRSRFGDLIKNALSSQELLVIQLALDEALERGIGLHSADFIEISTERYSKACNLEVNKDSYLKLYDAVDALYTNSITYDEDQCTIKTRLISSVQTSSSGFEAISINLCEFVIKAVLANEGNYQLFNTKVILQKEGMHSDYSKNLYDLLLGWAGIRHTFFMCIEMLQKELGIQPDRYLNMADFQANILSVALTEINRESHLLVTYESSVNRHGNATVAFDIIPKPIEQHQFMKSLN